MLLKEYNKGDIVFREGDRDSCMYRIIEGAVDVFITSKTEGEIVLTTLGQDRIFGEMAAIDAWPRSASIRVREDGTKLLEIERGELIEFFREDPYQVRSIMENLSHRLRGLTDDYLEVCGEITRHPNKPGVWGIKNLDKNIWKITFHDVHRAYAGDDPVGNSKRRGNRYDSLFFCVHELIWYLH